MNVATDVEEYHALRQHPGGALNRLLPLPLVSLHVEPFRDRTSKSEAVELLQVLIGRFGFPTDARALKAGEIAARLYLKQPLTEEERQSGQRLWTALAEARKHPPEGKRAMRIARHIVRECLDVIRG